MDKLKLVAARERLRSRADDIEVELNRLETEPKRESAPDALIEALLDNPDAAIDVKLSPDAAREKEKLALQIDAVYEALDEIDLQLNAVNEDEYLASLAQAKKDMAEAYRLAIQGGLCIRRSVRLREQIFETVRAYGRGSHVETLNCPVIPRADIWLEGSQSALGRMIREAIAMKYLDVNDPLLSEV